MQENTNMFNNKISKILIDEKNDTVTYFMENGNALSTNLSNILNSRKDIFKNFRIFQKCHELTTSFIKRRKLEKLLNPAIIEGLNDNVDIMEYIRCVKNQSKLPFELEHNTAESSLNLTNKLKMKIIARYERKLGAKVNIIDKNVFDIIKNKVNKMMSEPEKEKRPIIREEPSIISEEETDKKCEDVKGFLRDYYANISEDLENINELESIEYQLKTAINWYIKNQRNDKADFNIRIFKKLLDTERKYFYEPHVLKQHGDSEKNAILRYLEPLSIKNYELQKLKIRNLLSKGEIRDAEEIYINTLDALGIKLTRRELKKSIKDGIEYGWYYIQENRTFKRVQIKGNERILNNIEYLEKLKKQSKEMTEKQGTTKNEPKTVENKKAENTKKEEKKYSKEEITMIMQKCDKFSSKIKFQKGAIIPVIDALISYLKENKDEDVQNYLNNILSKINEIEPIDLMIEKEGKENKYNICILDYISNLYKNGIKDIGGKDIIINDERKYLYYTYLLNRRIARDSKSHEILGNDRIIEIKDEYNRNSENIELNYFEELLDRNKKETIGLKNKLLKAEKYSKAIQDFESNSKNEGIRFLALSEDLKNGVYRENVGSFTNLRFFTELREKIHKKIALNELTNPNLLKLIANIENEGIYNQLNNEVVKADKNAAKRVYEKLPDGSIAVEETKKENSNNNKDKERMTNLVQSKEKRKMVKELFKKMQHNNPEDRIEPETADQEENIYVCSDLHGQYELYKIMLGQLKDNDKLYILGDVIDRGPDGIKILQDILDHKNQVELFVGNHELMMIQSLFQKNEKELQNWIREANGGKKTQNDFLKLPIEEQEKIKELLLQSTVYKEICVNGENIYLVHAKAYQTTDKKQETVEDFLKKGREEELSDCVWARKNSIKGKDSNEVWRESDISKNNVFTIIGHTPTDQNKIEVYDTYAIVDCGASNYGNGCLLRLNDGKTVYFDNVTRCLEQLKNEEER